MSPASLVLEDLPFHIGATAVPRNPDGLPDTLHFGLEVRETCSCVRLEQQSSPKLRELLKKAYKIGLEIGTPLAADPQGQPYADDFLRFISEACPAVSGRALEIGAGVGYVSHCLALKGWDVTGLEPGGGYREKWIGLAANIVNEAFPSPRAQGPYDLIVSYAVLEHIEDTGAFITAIRDHLTLKGVVVLSVPDCSAEIATGDPAMLLHEHFHYFTASTLASCLRDAGFDVRVQPSKYGRCLYAAATPNVHTMALTQPSHEAEQIRSYPAIVNERIRAVEAAVRSRNSTDELAIMCPVRSLAVLSGCTDAALRFCDDDPGLQGLYLPPFACPIESRQALREWQPKELWIMSRTFGAKIRESLALELPRTRLLTAEEVLCERPNDGARRQRFHA